jgi:hypothetical protein
MPKQEVGSNLYLFTAQIMKYHDTSVIDAHGGYDSSTKKFTVPAGVTLVFYVSHGAIQNDFGLHKFRDSPTVYETRPPGSDCWDYSLSKYQGRHAGTEGKPAETYETVDQDVVAVEEELNKRQKYANNPAYLKAVGNKPLPTVFDVVTIRNRAFGGDMTLSTVIEKVRKVHPYKSIHCFFCRSSM